MLRYRLMLRYRVVPSWPGCVCHVDSADQLSEGGEDHDSDSAEQEGGASHDGTGAQLVPERATASLDLGRCATVVHLPLLDPG